MDVVNLPPQLIPNLMSDSSLPRGTFSDDKMGQLYLQEI